MKSFKNKLIYSVFCVLICLSAALTDLPGESANPMFLKVIPIKSVSAWAFEDIEVVPGGNAVGIKLYTKGLLAINVTSFECEDGGVVCPARDSGLAQGDVILKINSQNALDNKNFSQYVNSNGQTPINLTVERNKKQFSITVLPKKEKQSGEYKIGAWVRDSAAGIGTITFTRCDTNKFVALGHSIVDSDIGIPYSIERGSVEPAEIVGVTKGEKGAPGELCGMFSGAEVSGYIIAGDDFGLYGSTKEPVNANAQPMKVASKWQVKEGAATILSTVDDGGVKSYNIEIQKIAYNSGNSSRAMVIKITDAALIEKTGGIVQGMSGSPIIQNGLLVGALTHVFVNDPTRGYGIFAESMISGTN